MIMIEEPFDIIDIKTGTIIEDISQLRKYLFKFKIHEQPEFEIFWLQEDARTAAGSKPF